jgi:RND family efflux transporter MFP subunit
VTRSKAVWILVALALAGAAGYGYSVLRRGPEVRVERVERGPAIEAIYATGQVEPTVMVPIAPRSGGRLIALEADEGQNVRRGQVLARIESVELQRSVDEAQARARQAQIQVDRTRTLVAQQFVSAAELDRVSNDLDAARAALARAQAMQDYNLLTAPADGLVLRRDGERGQFIAPGQTVFTLSCCAPLRVSAEVDEEDIARVQVGQAVSLRSEALPQRLFDGEVAAITPKGDPVARSYRVRIRFRSDDTALQGLRPGMTMDANILIGRREQALLIPTRALVQPGPAVWRIEQGHLKRQPVRIGVRSPERVEILDGLEAGQMLVAEPTDTLQDGRPVRVAEAASGGER